MHLESKFLNLPRVPKYGFAWTANGYLKIPKYEYLLNTDIELYDSILFWFLEVIPK